MSELFKIFNIKKLNIYLIIFIILIISLFLFEVMVPFALAFIIAYLVNPLKNHLDHFLNETFSSLLSIIFFILCILSVLILVSPIIVQQIQNLISIIPGYITEIESLIKEINNKYLFSEKIKSLDYINVFKPLTKILPLEFVMEITFTSITNGRLFKIFKTKDQTLISFCNIGVFFLYFNFFSELYKFLERFWKLFCDFLL